MKRALLASLAAIAALSFASRARAQEAPPSEAAPATDHRVAMWRLELGYKGSLVSSAGYDPFSTNDSLSEVSLSASRTIWHHGRLSFAPGLSWDTGATEATARGDKATLTVHRVTAPLEGRAHFGAWGYAFLRAAPGVIVETAEIRDASSSTPLSKNRWLFATDLSAGYAFLAWPWSDADKLRARFWVQGDAGYGFAVRERLALSPQSSSDGPANTSAVDLGTLSMSGPFVRVAAAVSF